MHWKTAHKNICSHKYILNQRSSVCIYSSYGWSKALGLDWKIQSDQKIFRSLKREKAWFVREKKGFVREIRVEIVKITYGQKWWKTSSLVSSKRRFYWRAFGLANTRVVMESLDITKLMSEHGLSREEAGEVIRRLKATSMVPLHTAIDKFDLFTGNNYSKYMFLFLRLLVPFLGSVFDLPGLHFMKPAEAPAEAKTKAKPKGKAAAKAWEKDLLNSEAAGQGSEEEEPKKGKKAKQSEVEDEEPKKAKKAKQSEVQKEEPKKGKKAKQSEVEDEEPKKAKKAKQSEVQEEEPKKGKKAKQSEVEEEEPKKGKKAKQSEVQKEEPKKERRQGKARLRRRSQRKERRQGKARLRRRSRRKARRQGKARLRRRSQRKERRQGKARLRMRSPRKQRRLSKARFRRRSPRKERRQGKARLRMRSPRKQRRLSKARFRRRSPRKERRLSKARLRMRSPRKARCSRPRRLRERRAQGAQLPEWDTDSKRLISLNTSGILCHQLKWRRKRSLWKQMWPLLCHPHRQLRVWARCFVGRSKWYPKLCWRWRRSRTIRKRNRRSWLGCLDLQRFLF